MPNGIIKFQFADTPAIEHKKINAPGATPQTRPRGWALAGNWIPMGWRQVQASMAMHMGTGRGHAPAWILGMSISGINHPRTPGL